jgi:hypothetical protein
MGCATRGSLVWLLLRSGEHLVSTGQLPLLLPDDLRIEAVRTAVPCLDLYLTEPESAVLVCRS